VQEVSIILTWITASARDVYSTILAWERAGAGGGYYPDLGDDGWSRRCQPSQPEWELVQEVSTNLNWMRAGAGVVNYSILSDSWCRSCLLFYPEWQLVQELSTILSWVTAGAGGVYYSILSDSWCRRCLKVLKLSPSLTWVTAGAGSVYYLTNWVEEAVVLVPTCHGHEIICSYNKLNTVYDWPINITVTVVRLESD
jgi:hypothetical protein